MAPILLKEDKLPTKLFVGFSPEITDKINSIKDYNHTYNTGLIMLRDYLIGMIRYISHPVIAWDNNNRYQHSEDGSVHINESGYDVTFMILTNEEINQSYVYVINADLKPEEFGLDNPALLEHCYRTNYSTKRICHLTESQLYSVIETAVKRILILV